MYKKARKAPPFSLRLTFEERKQLNHDAGNMPLGAYIREQLLETTAPRKRCFRQPVQNEKLLAQLLTELGQSRLSNNLNQLAKASHKNALPLTPKARQELEQAAQDIRDMKAYLVQALGLKYEKSP